MKLTRDQTEKEKQTERYFKKLVGDDEGKNRQKKKKILECKKHLKGRKKTVLNTKDTDIQTNKDNEMF